MSEQLKNAPRKRRYEALKVDVRYKYADPETDAVEIITKPGHYEGVVKPTEVVDRGNLFKALTEFAEDKGRLKLWSRVGDCAMTSGAGVLLGVASTNLFFSPESFNIQECALIGTGATLAIGGFVRIRSALNRLVRVDETLKALERFRNENGIGWQTRTLRADVSRAEIPTDSDQDMLVVTQTDSALLGS